MFISGVIAVFVAFALQPPAPSRGNQNQEPQQQPNSQRSTTNPQGNQPTPDVPVSVNLPSATEQQPAPNQTPQNQGQQPPTPRWGDWLMVGFTGMIAAFTVVLAFVTALLVGVGLLQWLTYRDTLATNKTVERAYVSMTHEHPGLQFAGDEFSTKHEVRVTIGVHNTGNTPADVLGYNVTFVKGIPLVDHPGRPTVPTGPPVFVVMPRDHIFLWGNFPVESFQELQAIGDTKIPAFVIAWVVYRDRFGKTHRSGYARRLIQPLVNGANNLVLVEIPGYNYEEDLD